MSKSPSNFKLFGARTASAVNPPRPSDTPSPQTPFRSSTAVGEVGVGGATFDVNHNDPRYVVDFDGVGEKKTTPMEYKIALSPTGREYDGVGAGDGSFGRCSAAAAADDEENNLVEGCQRVIVDSCTRYRSVLFKLIVAVLVVGYTLYFAAAVVHNVDKATALIVITSLTSVAVVYVIVRDRFGDVIYRRCLRPTGDLVDRCWPVLKWYVFAF